MWSDCTIQTVAPSKSKHSYLVAHPTARKWVMTPATNGISLSRVNPLINGWTNPLTIRGMSHQVHSGAPIAATTLATMSPNLTYSIYPPFINSTVVVNGSPTNSYPTEHHIVWVHVQWSLLHEIYKKSMNDPIKEPIFNGKAPLNLMLTIHGFADSALFLGDSPWRWFIKNTI